MTLPRKERTRTLTSCFFKTLSLYFLRNSIMLLNEKGKGASGVTMGVGVGEVLVRVISVRPPTAPHAPHVNLVEGGQHGRRVLRVFEALRRALSHRPHLHL